MRVPDPRVFQASNLRKLAFCLRPAAGDGVRHRARQPGQLRRINAAVAGRQVALPPSRSAERAAALLQSPALRGCSGARPEKAAFSGR